MVHPGILDARNYFSWQKLFDKNTHFCCKIQNNSVKKAQKKIISVRKTSKENNSCQESSSFSYAQNISSCRNNFCQLMIFKIVISSSFTILIKSVNFHRICLQNCCQENNFCQHCCYSTENFYP